MKTTIRVIAILLMAITTESLMAQDLSGIEQECNESYAPMPNVDKQWNYICKAAFTHYCLKKFVESAEYRINNPGVRETQLRRAIRDIESNIRHICAGLRSDIRNACDYC